MVPTMRRHSDRWPAVSGAGVATGLLAAVLIAATVGACTSTTDDSGAAEGADSETTYTEAMSELCQSTSDELDALPTPPDLISRPDWAGEVARIFSAQASRFDAVSPTGDQRTDHRSLVETTEELAAAWAALSSALTDEPADVATTEPDAAGEAITDITELTLGRNDLVESMGLGACQASSAAS